MFNSSTSNFAAYDQIRQMLSLSLYRVIDLFEHGTLKIQNMKIQNRK